MNNYKNTPNPEMALKAIRMMVERVPTFIQQWDEINQRYKEFGWTDKLTDEERISEYQNINTSYQHFISMKKNDILTNVDKPIKLYNMVTKWLTSKKQIPSGGWKRTTLVYLALKDMWLFHLRKYVKLLMTKEELEKIKEE